LAKGTGHAGGTSYLALDVDFAEGNFFRIFEQRASLAREKGDVVITLFEQVLAGMIDDELSGIGI